MTATRVSWQDVTDRTDALSHALRIGGKRLPTADVARAHQVLRKVTARSKSGGRTVVVLAGATGSGKSSLFNALVAEPVSRIGARRPTTSVPTAALWGDEPSSELLDWLNVSTRHRVPRSARRAESLDGLILLDLPDFDSRVAKHRAEADRMIELADVFVWVTDPQKYADAVLHEDYVRQLAGHDAVSLVVLNQIDRLDAADVTECVDDLSRLLVADGLADVPVLPTSAVRGSGVADLAGKLASVIQEKDAAEQRLLADVRGVAKSLGSSVAAGESKLSGQDDAELTESLCRAAGLPAVVDAVRRDYRKQAVRRGGWPFTRWAGRLRSKARQRPGLDEASAMSRTGAKLALGRSDLPPATPAARAAVDLATRKLGRRAAEGLPAVWADSVQDAATPGDERLHDALDDAVLGTDVHGKPPAWWAISSALQWVFAAVAIVGLVWLAVLAVLDLSHREADWQKWIGVPIPLLLLVIGVVAGLLLALLSRWAAARGAERHAARVEARLRAVIAVVGVEQVINPIARVLQAHRDTREVLAAAAR